MLTQADKRFFDATVGRYYVTTATLPPGIFVRPLAIGDTPSAESLAIQAGAPSEQIKVITAALSTALDEAAMPPPGDLVLALSLTTK